jgi:hypothetical protein
MCQAQYGGAGLSAPPSGSAPPHSGSAPASPVAAGATGAPSAHAPSANGTAGSKTHTIIVAPTQGVLRFGKLSLSIAAHRERVADNSSIRCESYSGGYT